MVGWQATGTKAAVRWSKRGNGSAESVGREAEGEVATRALVKDWTISAGSLGCWVPRKPIDLTARRLVRSSLRRSPPAPALVCSRSPVKI